MINIPAIIKVEAQISELISKVEAKLREQYPSDGRDYISIDPEFSVYRGLDNIYIKLNVGKMDDFPEELSFDVSVNCLQSVKEIAEAEDILIINWGNMITLTLQYPLP